MFVDNLVKCFRREPLIVFTGYNTRIAASNKDPKITEDIYE